MRLTRRRVIWGAAALMAALAGGATLRHPAATLPEPRYETATVERGDVVARVSASGTVAARRTVTVSSQVSGRLEAVLVDFNAPVRRGELLARIDPRPFTAKVAQAEASAAAARANLEKARATAADQERQAARRRALLDRSLIAEEEWEAAQAAVAIARAEVGAAQASLAQTRAALDQARFDLASTSITAPVDGIVVSRDVDVGQTVAASLQAPTLFTLAEDLRSMEVKAHVSESDVGRLREGMAATFTVAANPREQLAGVVRQVRNAAETVESVVTYDVVLDVDNADLRLKPGMTANVTFTVAERRGVLRVPNAALRFQPPAAEAGAPGAPGAGARARGRVLHVVEGERLRPVPVEAGVTDGAFTEVAARELALGTRVATGAVGAAAARAERRSSGSGGPPPPPRVF